MDFKIRRSFDSLQIVSFFSSGGNVTDEKCDEILRSPNVDNEDDSTIINCKLSQEILPRLLDGVKTCREEFPPFGRLVYSCSSMVIQYLLPTITISVAYYQIYGQLKVRLDQKMRQLQISATPATNGGPAKATSAHSNLIDRIENDIHRMRRTIHLLISMGLAFCICWLPLNILNTSLVFALISASQVWMYHIISALTTGKNNHFAVLDLTQESRMTSRPISEQQTTIIYAVCHVMGMVSACANPIIYGFLNENFHREFSELYKKAKKAFCCLCKISSNSSAVIASPRANGQAGVPKETNTRSHAGRPSQPAQNGNNDAHSIEATPLIELRERNVTAIGGSPRNGTKSIDGNEPNQL